jgi:cytoskeletal protein CcmA (bactofilin family)
MAWKRDDQLHPEPPPPMPAAPPRPTSPAPADVHRHDRGMATIGASIFVKGDLHGEEDLIIEGRVEGKIDLKKNHVTIGKNGRVRADLFGKVIIIEGEVDGNVFAQEQAILRQSGAVRGNITSPRVILEDGSRFRGSIDMEPKETKASEPRESARPTVATTGSGASRTEATETAKHTPEGATAAVRAS